jgi:catechol 2,3-dioxygenase-like lactoylglutathione lyase family enzyme
MTYLPVSSQITFVYVKDLEASRNFYEDILGLELVVDQGACRIVRLAEEAYLGYCSIEGRKRGGEGVLLTLVTDDVDGWYQYLSGNNVNVLDSPKENQSYGIYHFFFQDPDNYMWEIQRFIDRNWNK